VCLSTEEIDSLSFLYSKYFNQSDNVDVKGLTFFTEFQRYVQNVKRSFDLQNDNDDVKKIFSLIFKPEFLTQVPQFRMIMQQIEKYYNPTSAPDIHEISRKCNVCSLDSIQCLSCKINYLSQCITKFDLGIQDGWDIFLRVMFGLPLYMFIVYKTEFSHETIFQATDLVSNSMAVLVYNALCDKSTTNFLKYDTCLPLIQDCKQVTSSMTDPKLEQLLLIFTNFFNSKIFMPFRTFFIKMYRKSKMKNDKINQIIPIIFAGFYLRIYLEAAPNKTKSAAELELRNVCKLLFKKYDGDKFEQLIEKIYLFKADLCKLILENHIVTNQYIRQLFLKYEFEQIVVDLDTNNNVF